jgi:hypothetical protein
VVNAINLPLVEVLEDFLIEVPRALKVCPERLLDDDAHPALLGLREPRLAELPDGLGVELGRDREVEEAVALRPALAVNLFEHPGEHLIALRVLDIRGQEPHPLREGVPDLFVHLLRLGELGHRRLHLLAVLFVRHRRPPEADDGELGGQKPLLHESVERRNQLPLGEVARRAEDDDRARLGGALQTHPRAQRVFYDGLCLHP